MKRFLAAIMAVAAISFAGTSDVQAQDYFGGYQFGAGLRAATGSGCCGYQREQPPYFAKFPTVYYSHVVKRPYGISPYAAPAGITPVEMTIPVAKPVVKINPFFNPDVTPVAEQQDEAVELEAEDKVTRWNNNPFFVEGIVAN